MPEDGYGWEKLFSERMCRHFREDYRRCRPASPATTTSTGRTAPTTAAARRRRRRSAARSSRRKLTGEHEIEIWGDGAADAQLHVHRRLRARAPRHSGSDDVRADQPRQRRAGDDQPAGRRSSRRSPGSGSSARYKLDAPQGVRGRNSDNTLILRAAGLGAVDVTSDWAGTDLLRDSYPTSRPGGGMKRVAVRDIR